MSSNDTQETNFFRSHFRLSVLTDGVNSQAIFRGIAIALGEDVKWNFPADEMPVAWL